VTREVLEYAQAEYKPVVTWALLSGGDGSLAATHWAMEHGADGVFHIDTGIGVKERNGLDVQEFVRETCKAYGWPLRIENPPEITYEEMVLAHGFPGPGAHLYPYVWLKDRAIAKLVRESKHKRNDRVGLSTGVRNGDSARRMGYSQPVMKVDARVWIAPLFHWNKLDLYDYIKEQGIKRSPIAELVGMSGECWCGAFAEPNELEAKIRPNFPCLYRQITDLQAKAKLAGVHAKWGVRPPKKKDKRQIEMPFMPLCVNCHIGEMKVVIS
jgi:3'-phosphoadenosine 5'-phosphosulfate sulfotransferase (PAPS reductase)/FAD synthetase